MRLSSVEEECVKKLAALFEEGETNWRSGDWGGIGLTDKNYETVLRVLEHRGAIKEMGQTNGPSFRWFVIYAKVLDIVRDIEDREERKQAMLRTEMLQKEIEERREREKTEERESKRIERRDRWIQWSLVLATTISIAICGYVFTRQPTVPPIINNITIPTQKVAP